MTKDKLQIILTRMQELRVRLRRLFRIFSRNKEAQEMEKIRSKINKV